MDTVLNIVLVEDHLSLRAVTAEILRLQGYQVTELSCAEDVEDEIVGQKVDIFILDLKLPGEDGISLARRLRSVHPKVGIIMMTAMDQPKDMEDGLVSGADNYLIKPVPGAVLLAAVTSLVRRLQNDNLGTNIHLHLDQSRMKVRGPEGAVGLSATEMALMVGLARAPLQRLALFSVSECLGQDEEGFKKSSIEVRVARLRKKLISVGAAPDCLKALRNEGYQLCIPVQID